MPRKTLTNDKLFGLLAMVLHDLGSGAPKDQSWRVAPLQQVIDSTVVPNEQKFKVCIGAVNAVIRDTEVSRVKIEKLYKHLLEELYEPDADPDPDALKEDL